jgi:hypothetical protein
MVKTIGSKANGIAVRTKCVCYLDCNAVTETIHVAKIARQPTIMTHACALMAAAVSHLQRWSANMYLQKKAWLISSDHDGRQHGHICR